MIAVGAKDLTSALIGGRCARCVPAALPRGRGLAAKPQLSGPTREGAPGPSQGGAARRRSVPAWTLYPDADRLISAAWSEQMASGLSLLRIRKEFGRRPYRSHRSGGGGDDSVRLAVTAG